MKSRFRVVKEFMAGSLLANVSGRSTALRIIRKSPGSVKP
jgi:hypothetical protein